MLLFLIHNLHHAPMQIKSIHLTRQLMRAALSRYFLSFTQHAATLNACKGGYVGIGVQWSIIDTIHQAVLSLDCNLNIYDWGPEDLFFLSIRRHMRAGCQSLTVWVCLCDAWGASECRYVVIAVSAYQHCSVCYLYRQHLPHVCRWQAAFHPPWFSSFLERWMSQRGWDNLLFKTSVYYPWRAGLSALKSSMLYNMIKQIFNILRRLSTGAPNFDQCHSITAGL